MQEFIIAIAISIAAPVLIGAASALRIRRARSRRESETIRNKQMGRFARAPALRATNTHLACGLFAALVLGALFPAPVAAKPVLGVTCSVAQTIKASACVRKIEQDLMNNVANPHVLVCLADGTLACCRKSNIGPGYDCTYVRVSMPEGVTNPLGNATNAPTESIGPPAGVFGGIGVLQQAAP